MKPTYTKMAKTDISPEYILRLNGDDTQSFIPIDPANSDYQAYLESLEPKASKVVDEAAPE
jgi:hypothetical protein